MKICEKTSECGFTINESGKSAIMTGDVNVEKSNRSLPFLATDCLVPIVKIST